MTEPNSPAAALFKALLAGWIAIVFGTSALLYFFAPLAQPTYHPNPALNALRGIWEVADAMGPVVKLSIVAVFGALVVVFLNTSRRRPALLYGSSIGFAVAAVLLVLALLPAGYSRGYGIGLTGLRFDAPLLPLYLAGAGLGGVIFAYTYTRLSKAR